MFDDDDHHDHDRDDDDDVVDGIETKYTILILQFCVFFAATATAATATAANVDVYH